MAGLRGLGQAAATALEDVKVLRKFVEQLPALAILNGQLVSGTIGAGSTFVRIRHSLDRAYQGGFVVGVSVPEPVYVQTPAAALAGQTEIRTLVAVVTMVPVTADTTVSVWVF
jgi:hypothetical protein